MADSMYRDYDERSRRHRSQSIFSDEGSGGRSRNGEPSYGRGRDEDRGFFERAGEEIRSWFGDDNDRGEHSRYGSDRDRYNSDRGRYDSNRSYGRRETAGVESWGQANNLDDDRSRRTGSHTDDHYRTWRERQMAELDRDYEDYCRERQQQFDSDFSTWRSQRQKSRSGSEAGPTGTRTTAESGGTASARSGSTAGRSRAATAQSSGETGTGKSGDDSSVKSSAAATQGRSTSRSRS